MYSAGPRDVSSLTQRLVSSPPHSTRVDVGSALRFAKNSALFDGSFPNYTFSSTASRLLCVRHETPVSCDTSPMVLRWLFCALAVIFLAGCDESSTGVSTVPSPIAPTPTLPTAPVVSAVHVGVAGNAEPTFELGQTKQFWALASYSDGATSDVTNSARWQTSNPVVATVSSTGLVTAAAFGAATITASVRERVGSMGLAVQPSGCRFTLDPPRLVFGPFANWGNVTVTAVPSDCRWSVASDAAWLQFRYDPGRSGDGGFGYSVPGNSTPHPRSANLVVVGTGGTSAVHVVEQERPRSCSYVAIPALTRLTLAGGTASFRVDATPDSCRWTTFMYSFYGSIVSGHSGTGDGSVTFSAHGSSYSNSITIEVRGLSGENPPGVHTIQLQ